jgi:hypothetical protein
MVANTRLIAGTQVGSVTRRLSVGLGFYRSTVVVNPTHFIEPSERETSAIENDQELFSSVLHRMNAPSFVPMEDALNLPVR